MGSTFSQRYKAVIVLLLIIWGFLLIGINDTWTGHNAVAGPWLSASIHHWKEQGAAAFHFLPVYNQNLGQTDPDTAHYYVHHPPLLAWSVGLTANFIGFKEFPFQISMRFLPISATLLSICAYYVLVRRLVGHRLGLLAAGLYAFTPMILYYGRMPGYEQMIPVFVLLYTAVFINWLRNPTRKRTLLLGFLAVFSMWTAWVAIFYLIPLGLVALVYGNRKQRTSMILIGVITGLATALIPALYEVLNPGTLQDLFDVFRFRVSNRASGPTSETFTLWEFVESTLEHTLMFLSFGVMILGGIGFRLVVRRANLLRWIGLALLMTPIGYLLVFRNAFYFHDYYKVHFLPFFSLAAALAVDAGWNSNPIGIRRFAKPFVVSIMLCSYVVSAGWLLMLHQSNNEPFSAVLIEELPRYTQPGDRILSNVQRPYQDVGYHAYRNIEWGILLEEAEEWAAETERDAYYLLCLSADTVQSYDGIFSELPYEMLAGECRLIDLSLYDKG